MAQAPMQAPMLTAPSANMSMRSSGADCGRSNSGRGGGSFGEGSVGGGRATRVGSESPRGGGCSKGGGGGSSQGGGGGSSKGGRGTVRHAASPATSSAAPLSRWEQMEKERAARQAADGGARAAFTGGLASTHGLSDDERERRDAAQRKLRKVLAEPSGCAKVLEDPKKLPTVKAGERWICQWEQLSLACPLEAGHFERNAHKVCCYCIVIAQP